MTFCYDLDQDGKLDSKELKMMVKGQLGEIGCDAQYTKLDSKLIENRDMFDKLATMLGHKGKTLKLNLLYRASRDTCKPSVFHAKVDGIYGTVTLMTSPKGEIFGGYLSIATD